MANHKHTALSRRIAAQNKSANGAHGSRSVLSRYSKRRAGSAAAASNVPDRPKRLDQIKGSLVYAEA